MPGDPLADSERLRHEAAAARERARAAAAGAADARGGDSTGVVTVSLDGDGHVAAVRVAAGWRRSLDPDELGNAVREAAQAAAVERLAAWGDAYADDTNVAAAVPHDGVAERLRTAATPAVPHDRFAEQLREAATPEVPQDRFAERLREAATARMSSADGRAALLELLAMAKAVERGLDEVSARLQSTLDATHTGRSADRHVTVTITGGGEVAGVRYDRGWLRDAHEINIGRQTLSAFTAAYAAAARSGVERLIADSSLGEVQRAAEDPFGLARRLRLSD
jgi:DNA-binding protein YbaB